MQQILAEYTTRSPNYRYWTGPRGEMYCYTTEPVDGHFSCWTYRPYGKGARTGKATRFTMVDRVDFARRKVAKARALARYQKAKAETK